MNSDWSDCLPDDADAALLVGRVWIDDTAVPARSGPVPVTVRAGRVHDASSLAPTVSRLLERPDLSAALRAADHLPDLGPLGEIAANSSAALRDRRHPFLLAPCDLQALKACGVTFVRSALERVIEEQAKGDPGRAEVVRSAIAAELGGRLTALEPGSPQAAAVKATLVERSLWSQYLEVAFGPDAEVFTKAQPMSAVGHGADIGIHRMSTWNNPEPEAVLAVTSSGIIVGAALGNDVNLRDVEGRSALLLGKAKDNNASCAIGPFIRLFDERFSLAHVERLEITLRVEGADGFVLADGSSMAEISRPPATLVAQAIGPHHQYPDGLMLFLGTLFAPIQDRDAPGRGFTHHVGDTVTISAPSLGTLTNRVAYADEAEPWTYGTGALMETLAARRG